MEPKTEVVLNEQDKAELREGQDLYEMTQSAGFQVLKKKLEDMAYHSWIDPRDVKDEADWKWRELNGFHAANVARELLEYVQQQISRAEYLDKKRRGELSVKKFTL